MKSHVLGLFYLETTTGKSAQVTGLKDSPGAVHPPNMVVYADAFKDLKADLRYTYKLHGLEQDVILRERPPSPADFGFDPEETELVVLTEFVAAPEPVRTGRVLKRKVRQGQAVDGLADETLEFGAMMMGLGKAFQLGDQGRPALDKAGSPVSVGKRWLKKDGRVFLLESVEYPDLKPHLPQLPPRPEARNHRPALPLESMVAAFDAPPASTEPFNGRMQVASLPLTGPGLVVDYDLVTTSTNFTFQGGTTYCVSNSVYLSGTTTIEGGAVVKFAPGVGWIAVQNTLDLKTSEYAPAVFTAMDDDLVGETISGSTGTPSGVYAYCTLYFNGASTMDLELRHLRISHCSMAAYSTLTGSAIVRDVQINNCGSEGVHFDANTSALKVYNSLITRQLYAIVSSATNVQIVNCTFDQSGAIVWINGNGGTHFTNNIVASSGLGLAPNPTAANNVVYNGYIPQVGATVSVNPFQVAGGGAYYLSEAGGCRNAGTANLDQAIKDVLARRTTESPQTVGGWLSGNVVFGKRVARDTDTPDLGYHYAPLDYVFAGCSLQSGSKLQVKAGTCIGVVNTNTTNSLPGIVLNPGGGTVEVWSSGRPNDLNRWVLFNAVQEAGSTNWNQNVSDLINSGDGGDVQGEFRFTELVVPGKTSVGSYQCYATSPNGALAFKHCRFNGGYFGLGGHDTTLFSCLLENVAMGGTPYGATNSLINCTLHRGNVTLAGSGTGGSVGVFDTLFAKTSLTQGTNVYHHHNGYDTNYSRLTPAQGTDVELNGVSFAEGAMGGFYLPSGSSLINAGSRSATNAGLFHFTTGTNQSKEASSTVDIGFHYVALNGSGQPVDTDGDGLPDYFEDSDGNGAWNTGETDVTKAYTYHPSLHDSLVDLDYDGVTALREYQAGTDPSDATDYVFEPVMLGRWRFDTSALTGDQGQIPRYTNNLSLVSSWNTNAVRLSGSNTLTRLVNVDYGNDASTNYHKWGIAAHGLTANDYWYPYVYPWLSDVTVTNLLWSDQTALPAGAALRVQNAPGLWGSTTGDLMYDGYVYDWNGAGISSAYTGLPPGRYELYLYGHGAADAQNTSFSVFTSTRDFGSRATLNTNTWNTNIWVEGVQFVKFTNLTLLAEQTLQINAIKVASAYTCVNGMQLKNTVASQLSYREVETNGLPNINLKRGTVAFWLKPDWTSGTGPGHEGRLLEVGDQGSTNGWWALYCSTNGSELKFAGKSGGSTSNYLTCPIGWSNAWTHVALAYSETNSALYLNGALATNGAGVTLLPDQVMRFLGGLNVGGDIAGWNNARGQIDELRTYNYPLTTAAIQAIYEADFNSPGFDSDGDGVPNYYDADPHNPAVAVWISFGIDAPRPGAVIR